MQTLLNLFAAIALLVWGTHIVRTGVLRVFGANLRQILRRSVGTRTGAFLAGIGVTSLLQSSTATALLASSFAGQGLMTTGAALAVMLGADVGTALMAQVLSLRLSWLAPLLIVVGVSIFLSRRNERAGQVGRIALGLGIIILALQLIVQASAPLTQAAGVKVLLSQLSGDALLDVLLGALFTVLCYSSLAIVLLTAALAASSVIAIPVALTLVLGANLGGGVVAVLTTLNADPISRRVPLGNLLAKATGCVLALALLPAALPWIHHLGDGDAQRLVLNLHLAFNALLAAIFLPCIVPLARAVDRWLPAKPAAEMPGQPRHLDPTALATPTLAIANAARESIRLADVVQEMVAGLYTVLRTNDFQLAEALRKRDDEIDRLYTAIKLYLTQVSREALEARESKRWADIIQFTINMEHAGDIVERVMLDVVEKKIQHNLSFSDAGMSEIEDLHRHLLVNLKLAVAVFVNGDLRSAQHLIAQKIAFRELEMRYADNHLQRLSGNTPQSIETSSLHLDLLADFKRMNSLFCSVAYPILESAGVLSKTRVVETSAPELGQPTAYDLN
ncbi:MAG TPA: Na/Pi cotransporter family protein [Burkholderiaceae bacterium]|nr:Na/Pi cotransporter family protein [Burkholderiaceae bacterium]